MPVFSNGFHPASSPRFTGSEPLPAPIKFSAVNVLDEYWKHYQMLLKNENLEATDADQADYEELKTITMTDTKAYDYDELVVIISKNVVYALKVDMNHLFNSEGRPHALVPRTFKEWLFRN